MKKCLMAVGVLAMSFAMGACWSNKKKNYRTEFIDVKKVVDSTMYGTCLQMKGTDTMLFMSDMGDTTWFVLRKAVVCGQPEVDNQLALMLEGKRTVRKLINISALMGIWVEPDPIEEGYEMGISLLDGGAASSINSRVNDYTRWSLFNGKLLVTSQNDMGSGIGESVIDTFDIMKLDADSLVMHSGEYTYRYGHPKDSAQATVDPYEIGDTTDYMQYMY